MRQISVFVPIYNEANSIKKNMNFLLCHLRNRFEEFELVLVDDNSNDNTLSVVTSLNSDAVSIIHFNNGPSRRENLGLAMLNAKFHTVMFIDADMSTHMIYLDELCRMIDKGADIAIGSRYKGIKCHRYFSRKLMSVCYNFFLRVYFGSNILDHQCGFKIFKKDALMILLKQTGYDSLFIRGWFWDAELIIRAQKLGFKIAEIPVMWEEGTQSSFKISRELKMVPYIIKLRFNI